MATPNKPDRQELVCLDCAEFFLGNGCMAICPDCHKKRGDEFWAVIDGQQPKAATPRKDKGK